LDLPDDDSDRLDQALLQELFGQTYASAAEASAAAADLPRDRLDRWNETIQPLRGIGEDAFFLNDHIPDGKTLLDFPTMRDLDEATYAAQERFRREDDAAYTGKPYRGGLYLGWARLYLDGRFTYATLSMAAGYIYAELDSAAADAVEDCIPYTFVPGPDHGKAGTKSRQWDMRRDAGGLEAMLDELDRRSMQHVSELFDSLLDRWHGLKRCGVYIFDNPDETAPQDHNVHIVFTDIEALAAVRPDFFVRDCRLIERPVSELNEAIATAKADATAWRSTSS
jgi:hypothetical protein